MLFNNGILFRISHYYRAKDFGTRMSILLNVEEADFNYIKEKTESTVGNLSVQLDKLVTAGYISKTTDGSGVKPRTICKMTDTGRNAMMKYVEALKTYFAGL